MRIALLLVLGCGALLALTSPTVADEAATPPSRTALAAGTLRSGTATLYSRAHHGDYERSTFSFEHGVRDDPGLALTRNDWELQYGNGDDTFHVCMVTDDRSVILDLGERALADVVDLPAIPPYRRGTTERATAVEGHVYLVATQDGDSDHLALFRVAKLVSGDRCTIQWIHWTPATPRSELELAPSTRERLARALSNAASASAAARRAAVGTLTEEPRIVFQIRTVAQGGNRSRLCLDGTTYRVPDEKTSSEFDVRAGAPDQHQPVWHLAGGLVPPGRVLVVESVDVYAEATGDSNGGGEAVVQLPGEAVFKVRDEEGPFQVWFRGRALVRPGQEKDVAIAVANSSAMDVRMFGRLVSDADAAGLEPAPFHPAVPPNEAPRAGGDVPNARRFLLEEPRVVLQVRAGAGGGNPNRVHLLGRGSIYLDRMSSRPIATEGAIDAHEDAVGYTSGGRIPQGKIWVVTRATWEGTAAGDGNGHGEILVQIGDVAAFSVRDTEGLQRGTWEGEVRILPGQEKRVFLEVANSSAAHVVVEGRFENQP